MAKDKTRFVCTSCGAEFPRWAGKCGNCDEWNTIVAEAAPQRAKVHDTRKILPLASISRDTLARVQSPVGEFNLVTGGGIVPGSVILIGGDPGIGKSTLALQVSHAFRTLYFSGEESALQIRDRAERLGVPIEKISVSSCIDTDDIIAIVESQRPECVIVDSVQTLHSGGMPAPAGSVSQIREASSRLVDMAKATGIPLLLIGHITKDGAIAGPKMLEHMVDTVLYFEGDFTRDYRILRSFKNRFGSVNEIGLFRMTEKGLEEIREKNSIFLNPNSSSAGNAVAAAIEGSRTILFEVQSLVTFTSFSNPRRMADGFDLNRLILLIAVLEKHGLLKLNSFDVFVNVAGGFQINETSADLAVAMSIASSLKNIPIPAHTGLAGEIALSGEIRPVPQLRRRILEFERSGFKTILCARKDADEVKNAGFPGEIIGAGTIAAAMDYLF